MGRATRFTSAQANPDLSVTLPDGSTGHMPGVIARAYEALGGRVTYFGKPYAPAFTEALALLGPEVDPSRVLHVGDSLMHDVAGAEAAGIHSLFVAGGIHAQELGIPDAAAEHEGGGASDRASGGELRADDLERIFDTYGVRPTASTAAFRW